MPDTKDSLDTVAPEVQQDGTVKTTLRLRKGAYRRLAVAKVVRESSIQDIVSTLAETYLPEVDAAPEIEAELANAR